MILGLRVGLAVVPFLAVWACDRPSEKSEQERDSPAIIVADRLVRAWATGDTTGVAELLAGVPRVHHYPSSSRYNGLKEFAWEIEHVHRWASDVQGVSRSPKLMSNEVAVVEWSLSGVQDRPIGALLPIVTKRSFNLRGVTLVEVNDAGNIEYVATYVDVASLVLELGGRIELPGGRELVLSQLEESESY